MFEAKKKKKINYGSICLLCFFCCVFAVEFMRFANSHKKFAVELPTQHLLPKDSNLNSHKLSEVKQYWRERPPTSYVLKIDSFKAIADAPNFEKYESRPFTAGGYNWTLILYPKGNKKDNAQNYVSLYIQMDNSTLLTNPHGVYAEVKLFVYNRGEDKYWVHQETEAKRFHLFKRTWGLPQLRPYDGFVNPGNGYVFDGDQCVFGADVFVTPYFDKWEVLSVVDNFHNPIYNWTVSGFSTLDQRLYLSNEFSIGGRNWSLKLYPEGDGVGQGNSLSLYVVLGRNEKLSPYQSLYLRAKLRILDQRQFKHVERQVGNWSGPWENGWGFQQFVSLADLRDASKGLVVNDMLKVQIQFEAFTKNNYFPN